MLTCSPFATLLPDSTSKPKDKPSGKVISLLDKSLPSIFLHLHTPCPPSPFNQTCFFPASMWHLQATCTLFLRSPWTYPHLTVSFFASWCSHIPSFPGLPEFTQTLNPPSWTFLHSNQKQLFVLSCVKMQNSKILDSICQLHKRLCKSLNIQHSSSSNA